MEKLRESEERQSFLLKLSDALWPLADPIEIQEVASRLLGEYMQVDRAAYGEMRDDNQVMDVWRDWSRPGMQSIAGAFPIEDAGQFTQQLRSGETAVVEDAEQDPDVSPEEYKKIWQGIDARAAIACASIKQDRMVAAIFVYSRGPRQWKQSEISLVEEVGERTWAAVERARAEAELREREHSSRLVLAQDEQLRKIAQELHDSIGARTAMIGMEVSQLENKLGREAQNVKDSFDRLRGHLMELTREIRDVARALHPPMIKDLGLAHALHALVEEQQATGVAISDEIGDCPRLSMDVETAVYRIVQEALSNAVRYASGAIVRVSLLCENEPKDELVLMIADDGPGFDVDTVQRAEGLGLTSMRQRASAIGATLTIESRVNEGARITLTLPLAEHCKTTK